MAKIEAEIFLLGIWKDFDDLESNISMPELIAIVTATRDKEKDNQRFLAALQGVDLDENSNNNPNKEFEDLKARVFSRGQATDSNDILSMQGINAEQAGFGIGNGLEYEVAGKDFHW